MSLRIIKAGLLDTIQDGGRHGYRHLGINPCGFMDPFSAMQANALLGKDLRSPVIEMHFPAPVIEFTSPTIMVLSGADFGPMLNGLPISNDQPWHVATGSRLEFTRPLSGSRCYLACLQTLDVESWLGSCSTDRKTIAGGKNGRPLTKDDIINFEEIFPEPPDGSFPLLSKAPPTKKSHRVRVIAGPEWNWFSERGRKQFLGSAFQLTRLSDRMGYRMQGLPIEREYNEQLLSSAVTMGMIQVLPDGQLVILMADHPTTGGYPRIAAVISTDLSDLGQLNPGEVIRFEQINPGEAEELKRNELALLTELKDYSAQHLQVYLNGLKTL